MKKLEYFFGKIKLCLYNLICKPSRAKKVMGEFYDDTFLGPTDELKRVYGEYLKNSKQKREHSMSDTETADLGDITSYDLLATRLECLELAIKVFGVSGYELSDTKILGLAEKFEKFVLKDMQISNHLCPGQN